MQNATAPTARARILLVDDSAFEQHVLADLLREQGYKVLTASNGREGVELAVARMPDLIVLDVHMPYVDGFAACRLLKANPLTQAIPVIFVSGVDSEAERLEGLSVGGVDFVRKPYSGIELCARIRVHLGLMPRQASAAPAPLEDGAAGPDQALVDAARKLIDDNLDDLPELDEIAAKLGTYREKLSAVFKDATGLTVFAYAREQRIEQAKLLLRTTQLDVQSIALTLGFSSSGNFATAFKERTGTAPSAYRTARNGQS